MVISGDVHVDDPNYDKWILNQIVPPVEQLHLKAPTNAMMNVLTHDLKTKQSWIAEKLSEAQAVLHDYYDTVYNFHKAAFLGDRDALRQALDWTQTLTFKLDVNDYYNGESALTKACIKGKSDIVSDLIDAGIDIHRKDNNGQTALDVASGYGYLKIVTQLLDAGADVHARHGPKQVTPLHTACGGGELLVVERLLAAGSDLHAKSDDGETCLHFACKSGNEELVQRLIEIGIDITERDGYGNTGLHIVCEECEYPNLVSILADAEIDIEAKDNSGRNAFHNACRAEVQENTSYQEECIVELIRSGCDLNSKERDGCTGLQFACFNLLPTAIVEILIEEGADVNVTDSFHNGKSILEDSRLIQPWNSKITQMLVDAGIRYSSFENIASKYIKGSIAEAVRDNNARRQATEEALRKIAFQETADLDEVLDFLFLPLCSAASVYRPVEIKPPPPAASTYAHLIGLSSY